MSFLLQVKIYSSSHVAFNDLKKERVVQEVRQDQLLVRLRHAQDQFDALLESASEPGLSDAEIDRMVEDAEAHASEDEENREKVEARNQLDSLVYQVEKDAGEWGDKVEESTKNRLESALEQAKEALKGDDPEILNNARDQLMQAFSTAGQEMYQAQAAEAGAEEVVSDDEATEESQEKNDEDVIEADYEIVDEEA